MNYRTAFLFYCLFLLWLNGIAAQSPDSIETKLLGWMARGDTSVFVISKEANNYLDTTQSVTKESFAKKYGRWYNFWHNRVDSFGKTENAGLYMINNLESLSNSCNNDGNWTLIGPTHDNNQNLGIVNSIFVPRANSDTIFAGSNTGGLWRTFNANSTRPDWHCITDNQKLSAMGIQSIAVDPVNKDVMYIASGYSTHTFVNYGYGLLKSTNANAPSGQVLWQSTGLTWGLNSYKGNISRVVTHPTDSGFVLVGSGSRVYKSTDGGDNFRSVLFDTTTTNFHDFEFLPSNHAVIFVSSKNKVFVSIDEGENWQEITPTGICTFNSAPLHIDVVDSDPNSVYLHFRCSDNSTPLYKNTFVNGILQGWVLPHANASNINSYIHGQNGINEWQSEFTMSPNNPNIAYAAAHWFYKRNYTQQGSGWVSTGHADNRDLIVFDDGNNDVLYVGNDGGVSKSTDNGVTWINLNGNGPQITQFWDMGVSSERKDFIIAGAQDNSQFIYNGNSWINFTNPGGDGFQSLVSWDDPNIVYTSGNGILALSTNGGTSGSSFNTTAYNISLGNRGGTFVNFVFRQDPNHSNIYYAAKFRVFEKLEASNSGSLPSPSLNNPQIQVISNLDRCYSNCDPIPNNPLPPPPVYGTTNIIPVNPQCNNANDLGWSIVDVQIAPSSSNIIYMAISWNVWARECVKTQKLWRSDDGGLTWRSFGNFWWNITTIAVNPENQNEIWVGFSGFGNPSNSAISQRVYHCADASLASPQFTDISNGLPFFPIQSLIYQKGGNGTLYCGNDIGVYRYDPNQQKWLCFSSGLPSIIVADLEINYCEKMLYCSAYGRGIWRTPLHEVGAWTINKNTTINNGTKTHIANDIIIKAPNSLTVNGTLNMSKDRKIIVEPGAKLYVNGGKISNLCGDSWQGIEVWGKYQSAQEPISQGYLEINDGTIEYAKEAVRLWKPGDLTSTGGIIKATNAKFLNNWRSIEFMKYTNGVLGQGGVFIPRPNVSSFYKCQFTIDDNYRAFSASVPFKGHVSMWHVDGIKVQGCTFEHKNNNSTLFSRAEDYGFGIHTIDAHFFTLRACNGNVYPCTNWEENTFYRLYDGVRISNALSIYSPVIEFANFKDCHYGVYNDGVSAMELVRSTFEIGGFPKAVVGAANIQEGLVLNHTTGFTISENTFSNSLTNPTAATRLGTRTVDAGQNNNIIYKNTFSTSFGQLANGVNANQSNVNGLQFQCNNHSNAISDITAFNGYSSLPSLVIARNQGSLLRPAGNSFNSTTIFNANNYLNPPQQTLNYFYYQGAANQNPVLKRNVNAFGTFNQNGCSSILPPLDQGITGLLSNTQVNELINTYHELAIKSQQQKDSFKLKLDLGNTAQWVYLAQIAGPDTINANIIGKILVDDIAPWVSDTVIKTMFNNPHFSKNRILKTMEANPDVMKDAAMMEIAIGSGKFNQNQINTLREAMSIYTERTAKEGLLSDYEAQKTEIVYRLIRNELNQESIDWLTVDNWLKQIPSPTHDYLRCEMYAMLKDWGKSNQIMDSIPMKYKLNAEEALDHADYKNLHQLLQNTQTNTIANLSTDHKYILEQLAQKGYSHASTQAQGILNFFYGGEYRRQALFPLEIQARMMQEEPIENAENNEIYSTKIKLQPNPSKDLVQAIFSLPEGKTEGTLKVLDVSGRIIYSQVIAKENNDIDFNVGTWAAGIYYVYLEGADWKSSPVALSVQK